MPVYQPVKVNSAHSKRRSERGNVLIECALVMIVAVPLLLGVSSIGIRMGRSIQATQLTRDVAHMYALGADFSTAGTQAIASTLGQGFNLTSSGDSVLIFSRIQKIYQLDCNAAGIPNCANINQPAVAQRIVLGNRTLRSSSFGTPSAASINSQGNVNSVDYFQQPSAVASGFDSVMALQRGQSAYLVEGFFPMPDLDFLNPNAAAGGGFYVRFIF